MENIDEATEDYEPNPFHAEINWATAFGVVFIFTGFIWGWYFWILAVLLFILAAVKKK